MTEQKLIHLDSDDGQYRVFNSNDEREFSDVRNKKFEFVRQELFGDCPHVSQIATPYSLCDEMVAQLPDLNGKWALVLFNPEFYMSIIDKYPLANIVFITGSKKAIGMKFKGIWQIIELDPFNDIDILEVFKMKFDVVIGNPPYQMPKNRKGDATNGTCGSILWDKFVTKSIELCNEGGYVSLIHPGQWRKPGSQLLKSIKEMNLIYLEMHDLDSGLKTFKASTGYDWYVAQKTKYSGKTTIKDFNGEVSKMDLSLANFIPNSNFDLLDKILAKDDDLKCEVLFSHSSYETRKSWMSKTQNDVFKYPCIYGITKKDGLKIWYSKDNSKGHFGISKVILPVSKYTDVYIDDEGKYGLCQFAFGIKVDSKNDAENIKKALVSDEFKKIWQASEWIYNSKEWRIFKHFKKEFWKEFV